MGSVTSLSVALVGRFPCPLRWLVGFVDRVVGWSLGLT